MKSEEKMRFNQKIHTKEYLIANTAVLLDLCRTSAAFACSELAADLDILKTVCDPVFNMTAAHVLPQKFSIPIDVLRANDFEILKLRDRHDETVAHRIAKFNNDLWSLNIENHKEILLLKRATGTTVAHNLASNSPQLFQDRIGPDLEILLIDDGKGFTVASSFALSAKGIDLNTDMVMQKNLLTKYYSSNSQTLFAEIVVGRLGEKLKIGVREMALHMITLGAAYRHSSCYGSDIGKYLVDNVKILIADALEPKLSIKYAMALYSTLSHNIENLKQELDQEQSYQECSLIFDEAKKILEECLIMNPHYAECIDTDFLCEPAEVYVKQHLSKMNFSLGKLNNLGENIEYNDDVLIATPSITLY
jgi:hypothetical protein